MEGWAALLFLATGGDTVVVVSLSVSCCCKGQIIGINSAVAISGIPNPEHSFFIRFVFVALDQQDVILHPADFTP